ncbi:two-component regulator propeller domain-containing protein [Niabella yanshanensis]|uniref:histidine kinase n=1 Tax=Niabella yanshanensis TaxID=577386 RepID=A0ABZ0W9S3_9BACT|nr:hybrid sensor histidine kinase/response regulator transcription factor [Niabella yanshanensis]WQD39269.1 two-component regulator propeller domain-containing protein [Niabella yanshanensis]
MQTCVVFAQVKYKTEYFTSEDGLSHRMVSTMLKDDDGFMWFGTWNGINRFDGKNFKSFKTSALGSQRIHNDRVRQVVDDHKGFLWIITYDKYLYCFDKHKEIFLPVSDIINKAAGKIVQVHGISAITGDRIWLITVNGGALCLPLRGITPGSIIRYSADSPKANRLDSNHIFFIHKDEEDNVWISNTGGISRFKRAGSGIYRREEPVQIGEGRRNFTKASENAHYIYFTSHNGAVGVYVKKKNKLYLTAFPRETIESVHCSKFSGLVYMTTASGKLITAEYRENGLSYVKKQSSYRMGNMFEDSNGNLWIEAVDKGVLLLKKGLDGFKFYASGIAGKRNVSNRFTALQDFNKTVWITYSNGELVYYNERDDEMVAALPLEGSSNKLFNSVYRIFYDSGVLWVGSEFRGVTKLIIQRNIFQLENISETAHFPDLEVRAVYFDKQNRRWASTQGGQLTVHQNGTNKLLRFNNKPLSEYSIVAYAIMEDSRGNIWIGTKNDGLYKAIPTDLERNSYQLQHYPTVANEKKGFRIYSILEDRLHNIWIGSYDAGLIRVNDDQGVCRFYRVPVSLPKYPANTFEQVRHLSMDRNGMVWAATTGGLLTLQSADRHGSGRYKVRIYRKQVQANKGLPDNDVLYLIPTVESKMWITTAGGGISLATKTAGGGLSFESWGTRQGLANDYVLNGVEDKWGNIWLATEGGLSCLHSKNKHIVNYDSYDGLPSIGFSEGACSKDVQGNLVWGTSQGLMTFNPANLQRVLKPSGMLLTSLQVNNVEITPGGENKVADSDINYINALTLQHNQNTIAINYVIPDYRRNVHEYSFRLTGFNNNWSRDVSGRAVFTNLSPGKYTFEVKGDGEDYNKSTYRKLSIIIKPPFWGTWWAYCIYGIFAIVIIELIRRTVTTMIRLRNKVVIEQQLSEMKLNFFTNISHELRTPLTLIVNPLEQLSKKEKLSPQGQGYLSVISKNANRMVHFINQLLDFRKVQSGKLTLHASGMDIVQLAYGIAAHFEAEQSEKEIDFQITSVRPNIMVYIDSEKIATVIYNLLANAFKFTPPGKAILLNIASEQENITVTVEDQGPGISKDQLKNIFKLFHSGTYSDNRQMKGVGIGLALAKELVELHGGHIEAFNNRHGGLTVQFAVPDKNITGFGVPANDRQPDPSTLNMVMSAEPDLEAGQGTGEKRLLPQVLLVEDNEELRVFLAQQLKEYYHVTTATNGVEGYHTAQKLQPDLIISDVMMPEMDGIEMLDRLKNSITTSHIPVVLLTARSSVESQIEGIQYGADFYITKPFNSNLLFASVNSLLKQRARLFGLLEGRSRISLTPEMATSQPVNENVETEPVARMEKPVVTEKDEQFLEEVIKVVEDKMGDYNFNIELVAGSMNMGRTTFYKKFKSLTGITPVEFVKDRRLDKAKTYLDAGAVNISEAAYNSGFNNPKYFSTCFKERFGVSPTDYLKNRK